MTGNVVLNASIKPSQSEIEWLIREYMGLTGRGNERVLYRPVFQPFVNGKFSLKREYPPIGEGSRNMSLLSLAGQLKSSGYPTSMIYRELLKCNAEACDPPLSQREVERIARNIGRYRR